MPQDVRDFTTAAVIRPQPLGFVQPGINSTQTVTFPIDTGTHAISLLTGTGTGLPTPQLAQSIKVHGNSSGVDYYVSPTPLTTFYQVVPIDSGRDISVDVTVQSQVAQDTRVYVSAIFDTQVVFIAGQPDLTAVLGKVDVTDRSARLLGLVRATTTPALWQAPTTTKALAIRNLAAAGTFSLVAAVAGQQVYTFQLQVQVDEAAGGAAFEVFRIRSDSTFVGVMGGDGAGAPRVWNHTGGGAPGPLGEGLQLINNDNIAHNFSVSLGFSQG